MSYVQPFRCRVCRLARMTWRAIAAHYRMSPGHRPVLVMHHKGMG